MKIGRIKNKTLLNLNFNLLGMILAANNPKPSINLAMIQKVVALLEVV